MRRPQARAELEWALGGLAPAPAPTLTCKQIARFTRQPREVLTARGWRPRSLNSFEKDCVSAIRGRSSATTTHVRTRDKSSPRAWRQGRR